MYRSQQLKTEINIVFDDGGLGDCIARLPAIHYITKNHPHVWVHLWIPDYFYFFAKRSLKKSRHIILYKYSEHKKKFQKRFTRAFSPHKHSNLAYHMTDHAFNILTNKQVLDSNDKNYLKVDIKDVSVKKFNLPGKYVVITTAYTAAAREFKPEHINKIVDYVIERGYTPVFLGKKMTHSGYKYIIEGTIKEDEINFSKGVDLLDQTSLLEAAKICENSQCVLGLDNGLLHVAACTDVPVVAGYNIVQPEYRMPYREGVLGKDIYPVVPPKSLKCRFCQGNWGFCYNKKDGSDSHSFTTCWYSDYKCLDELNADLYIKELEKIL